MDIAPSQSLIVLPKTAANRTLINHIYENSQKRINPDHLFSCYGTI